MRILPALLLAVAAISLLPSPATAGTAKKKASSEEVVCRVFSTPGSRITRTRVCKTRALWELHELEAFQYLLSLQSQDGGYGGINGPALTVPRGNNQ